MTLTSETPVLHTAPVELSVYRIEPGMVILWQSEWWNEESSHTPHMVTAVSFKGEPTLWIHPFDQSPYSFAIYPVNAFRRTVRVVGGNIPEVMWWDTRG